MESKNNGSATCWPDTEAGRQVQKRLSEERTLKGIDHLLAKIDTLEKAVDNLTNIIAQAPGFVAMGSDMVDEAYRKADANGVSIDKRLKNALTIAEKLTSPEMVEKLDKLLSLTDQLPGLMAMKVDMLDEAYRQADARGVNIEERLGLALQMAEKLTAPAMVDKLDGLLKIADQAPGLVAMKVDMLDEAYRQADARGVNIEERLGLALQMAEKLTAPEMMEKLDNLLQLGDRVPGLVAMTMDMVDEAMKQTIESGFDPKALMETSRTANNALTYAKSVPPKSISLFGIMGALKDKDRQRGLGFLMNFLKHFGKNI